MATLTLKPREAGQAEAAAALKRELEPVFRNAPECIIMGHGTGREQAESILREGLRARSPNLNATAIYLVDKERRENGISAGYEDLLSWPHKGLKAIVVIKMPAGATGRELRKNNRISPDEHMWVRDGREETAYSSNWVLPAKYIAGFVDAEALKFVPNPLFEENPELPGPLPPRELPEWLKKFEENRGKRARG
jgi:hypothetical protein